MEALSRLAPEAPAAPSGGPRFKRRLRSPPDYEALLKSVPEERAIAYLTEPRLRRLAYHVCSALAVEEDALSAYPLIRAEVECSEEEVVRVAEDLKAAGWLSRV